MVGQHEKHVANPAHPPLRGTLHRRRNASDFIKCCHKTRTFFIRPVQGSCILLFPSWLVSKPFTPSSQILETSKSRTTLASIETFAALLKNGRLVSFLEGGSAMLLFDGTVAAIFFSSGLADVAQRLGPNRKISGYKMRLST